MAAVDFRADATIADIGVDGIGEIDGVRAAGQRDQAALRREAEHLIEEQLELRVLQKLLGIIALQEIVDELAKPLIGGAFAGRRAFHAARISVQLGERRELVAGVRGDAIFGDLMHFRGPHLQLDALMARANDGGVDRLVLVMLWRRDVVLETARHHAPGRVDHAKRGVAILAWSGR